MIKNILFDMGGVVFLQDTEQAFRRFREAGITDTDRYMGAFGQKEFFMDIESGAIDAEEFLRRMAEATGRQSLTQEEVAYCWLGFLGSVPVERLRYLERLRPKYHLGLLSNTNPFMMAFTRSKAFSSDGRPISDYFDSEFCSYEMRVCKPHPDIFLRALAADGMRPEETLFVDDSTKNTDAAAALGLHVLPVVSNENWIPQLEELLAKLG